MSENPLSALRERLAQIDDLKSAEALLYWDQATYMPAGGGPARGRQMATLARLAHERFTDPAFGELLNAAEAQQHNSTGDSTDSRLLRVVRRDYDRAMRVPPSFVSELASHQAASYDAWVRARPANDFSAVRPFLERTVELSRAYSAFFPAGSHVADPLIDGADEGMTADLIRALFADLRRELVPLVQAITAQPPADDSCLLQAFPVEDQLAFGRSIIADYGYDFERGRQDLTAHPFMTKFSLGDVRITARAKANDLGDAIFSTLHEGGHALYEQGIDQGFEATPLADGASSGIHESQSRLWENIVGRSRPFWTVYYPKLQQVFPTQLGTVSLDTFYRAINRVDRSLIRTDADEVTYNLHIIIRFELELAMLEGRLMVRDLPEAWRERYRLDLGITPEDDRDGCLQDVHWFAGLVGGAFQCYTIGNVLSAQLYAAACQADPSIPAAIAAGSFGPLLGWLRTHLHRSGRSFPPVETIRRATGRPLEIADYVQYLRTKFGELYDLRGV